jgi:hypothetical protein
LGTQHEQRCNIQADKRLAASGVAGFANYERARHNFLAMGKEGKLAQVGRLANKGCTDMINLNRCFNWDNRDYRDYCDHRTRLKQRLRLRVSIAVTLLVLLLLVTGLGTESAWVGAQPSRPGSAAPMPSARTHQQTPDDPTANPEGQQSTPLANKPGRNDLGSTLGPVP